MVIEQIQKDDIKLNLSWWLIKKPWCDTVQTVEDVFGVDDGLATKLFAA